MDFHMIFTTMNYTFENNNIDHSHNTRNIDRFTIDWETNPYQGIELPVS